MDDDELKAWFVSAVLPLEPNLLAYIRRYTKERDDARDILHDVYESALAGASKGRPQHTRAYIYAIARNSLITRARRAQVVSFELVADLDALHLDHDLLTPERHVSGREELHRIIQGMEQLPSRCREMVRLRKVEGLSIREIAMQLDVSIKAVERQLTVGMRALSDLMLGGSGKVRRRRGDLNRPGRKETAHD